MSMRVLIAAYDSAYRERIGAMVNRTDGFTIAGLARDGQETMQMAIQLSPDIAVIDYDLPGISGRETCEMLSALRPNTMCVLLCDSRSADTVELAMRAGARAVAPHTPEPHSFGLLLQDMAEVRKRRDSREFAEWNDPRRFPKAITITGAKGGVGKTTVSVNLAVMLATMFPEQVVLMDMYTQFGDVDTMLNMKPRHFIAEMGAACTDMDEELLDNYVTRHSCGVHVIAMSDEPLAFDAVSVECLDHLLYMLRRKYRFIVMDLPPMLHEYTFHMLSHSDVILLMANLFDLTTAADTKRFYDVLQKEGIPSEKLHVVLNRESRTNRLTNGDLSGMFEQGAVFHIPNDNRLVGTVNEGIPFVLQEPTSPLTEAIRRMAESISGVENVKNEPRRGFKGRS